MQGYKHNHARAHTHSLTQYTRPQVRTNPRIQVYPYANMYTHARMRCVSKETYPYGQKDL